MRLWSTKAKDPRTILKDKAKDVLRQHRSFEASEVTLCGDCHEKERRLFARIETQVTEYLVFVDKSYNVPAAVSAATKANGLCDDYLKEYVNNPPNCCR